MIDEIYYKVSHLEPWEKGSRKTAGQTGMCGGVSTIWILIYLIEILVAILKVHCDLLTNLYYNLGTTTNLELRQNILTNYSKNT